MSEFLKNSLGDKCNQLSPLIQQAHTGKVRLEGFADIRRGNGLARLICNILSMPPEKNQSWLVVEGDHLHDRMIWNRRFDDFVMNSLFLKDGNYLIEKLGPIKMWLVLDVADGVLSYKLSKTRLFGIPIPSFLSPSVKAEEWQEGNVYVFKVQVSLPFVGLLIAYAGRLNVGGGL